LNHAITPPGSRRRAAHPRSGGLGLAPPASGRAMAGRFCAAPWSIVSYSRVRPS
jgi:hypothetical protein